MEKDMTQEEIIKKLELMGRLMPEVRWRISKQAGGILKQVI